MEQCTWLFPLFSPKREAPVSGVGSKVVCTHFFFQKKCLFFYKKKRRILIMDVDQHEQIQVIARLMESNIPFNYQFIKAVATLEFRCSINLCYFYNV